MRINQYLQAIGLVLLLAGCESATTTPAAPIMQKEAPISTIAPKQSTGMIGITGYTCGADINLSKSMTCPQACSDRGIDASNSGKPPCMESGDCMLVITGANACQCCVKK
ncbi:MAG: hypothetical protein KBA75_08345 [Alphaproteobacteria bacterium]|nr:hypothetical protein [Alphaproteobacteria bacterium]